MDARTILVRPVISEKSYALIAEGKYTFRVDDRAHKTQIAQAVEEVFSVNVAAVRTSKVRPKPKRRGLTKGRTRAWKKAVVQLAPGERIELFEGGQTAEEIERCRTAKPNRPARAAASRRIPCASR
jgi:large subunit ribosomal protein L23